MRISDWSSDVCSSDLQIIEWVRNYRRQETEAAGGGRRVMLRVITEPLHAIIQKLKLLTIEGNPYIFAGENRQGQLTEINRIWYRVRDEAKLIKAAGTKQRLHALRHFYGQINRKSTRLNS